MRHLSSPRLASLVSLFLLGVVLSTSAWIVAEAASLALFSDAACTQNQGTYGNVAGDGSCQANGGNSARINCMSGQPAQVTFYSQVTNCNTTNAITGTGSGDGNTCIPMNGGFLWIKVNCNSAFLTASLSVFWMIAAICLAILLQQVTVN